MPRRKNAVIDADTTIPVETTETDVPTTPSPDATENDAVYQAASKAAAEGDDAENAVIIASAIDVQHRENWKRIQELREQITKVQDKRLIIKDMDKFLAMQEKEITEQYLDAIKAEKTAYQKIRDEIFQISLF